LVTRDLVEPLAQLSQRDVHAHGVGPRLHLVRFAHVQEVHVLAASEPRFDLGGLHFGIGHIPTLRPKLHDAPGRPRPAGTLARWPYLGNSSTRTRSSWPRCTRTGSSSSGPSSPRSASGPPSSCC